MENMWFDSWESIFKIVCVTPMAYGTLIILLRVSGKRTLSKMNAFDFVVTIAIGSILASVVLNQDIPYINGVVAMLSLILLQYILTWLSVRMEAVGILITSSPTLVFYKGNFQHRILKKERLTVEEIHSAARQEGFSTLEGIEMIILETTGDIAFIREIAGKDESTLGNVVIAEIMNAPSVNLH